MGAMVKVIPCQEEKINGCVSVKTVQRGSRKGHNHDEFYPVNADCDDNALSENDELPFTIMMMMATMMTTMIMMMTMMRMRMTMMTMTMMIE